MVTHRRVREGHVREEGVRWGSLNFFLVLVRLLKSNSVLICELSLISTSNSST
jgi:hypothetical protein